MNSSVRYGLKLVPQYTTVDELRTVWSLADEAGFEHCWTYDHFASVDSGPEQQGVEGPTYEGWMLLAAMAERTERVRLGCMVTSATFRNPGVLATMATTVDHLSGGRLELGLGAGWGDFEHESLGIPLGSPRDRLDRLEETCVVLRALFTQPRTSFEGRHWRLRDAVHEPKPLQAPVPLWIGGAGRRRTLRIAARYASAWNMVAQSPELFGELCTVLDEHCTAIGREPSEIRRTVQIFLQDRDVEVIEAIVEPYVRAGAQDVVLVVRGAGAVGQARGLAAALPRLRALGGPAG